MRDTTIKNQQKKKLSNLIDKLEYHWKEIYQDILAHDNEDTGLINLTIFRKCTNPIVILSRQDIETIKMMYRTNNTCSDFGFINQNKFKLSPVKTEPIIDYNRLSIDIFKDKEKHENFSKIMKKQIWNKRMNIHG